MERLQKVIANSGYCSRRKAEDLIEKGMVFVNNKKITELGHKVSSSDEVRINDIVLTNENKVYYLLNKPRGIVSTTEDDKKRKTVIDLIPTNIRIFPVGRLDYDTTGAIILTNDGEFANFLMHPKNEIEKVYIAKVKGILFPDIIKKLENGVVIDGKKTNKCSVKVKKYDKKTNTSIVQLVIHEGRNHQVKKMFELIGSDVIKLKRESIGIFHIDGLKSGNYRPLSIKEVKVIYSMINKK